MHEDVNEREYKALLKKQLELGKHVGELKKTAAREVKISAQVEEQKQKKQLAKLANE